MDLRLAAAHCTPITFFMCRLHPGLANPGRTRRGDPHHRLRSPTLRFDPNAFVPLDIAPLLTESEAENILYQYGLGHSSSFNHHQCEKRTHVPVPGNTHCLDSCQVQYERRKHDQYITGPRTTPVEGPVTEHGGSDTGDGEHTVQRA